MRSESLLLVLPLLLAAPCASIEPAARRSAQAVELGRVAWGRDHDACFERARAEHAPVLLLFQEVPG